ncbi:MAG: carboxypeptidase regulatory-like domain-containing protein [Planctomycetota bacterium]|jgi:hypothetical protein
MKTVFTISILISIMLIASIAWSDIIHVPGDQPTIQAGIDAAADGDTVLIADGTYTGAGNKDLDFNGKAITVTSENGAENCIIDCEYNGRGFHFHSGETEESVVSGFTITNGSPNDDLGGGGICCVNLSSPTIEENLILENLTSESGGGIYCYKSSPTIQNNKISGNSAQSGGGIFCNFSSSTIQNNVINGNSANMNGGGIYCFMAEFSPLIINNIISENSAYDGGGIYCYDYYIFSGFGPIIINSTISGNSASNSAGGIACKYFSSPTVFNTILWADTPNEIHVDVTSDINITYSDIQGGWPGEGNIDADPLFIDPDSDFHLSDNSPCIGAGIMTPDVPDTDIEGNPRPNPPDSNPDMGAYENPLAPAFGSISGNVVDAETGNPITFAFIIAINSDTKGRYKAFTDETGDYEIPELPAATYWVICIKKGYQAGIARIEVEPGIVTPCNFVLRRKVE